MFSIRVAVLICLGVVVAGASGCDRSEVVQRSLEDPGPQEIRKVVFQEPTKAPADQGQMLPEAMQGLFGNGEGGAVVDSADAMNWVNDTFQSLKEKGMTKAKDAGSWLTQDFKNMNAWEYKVVTLNSGKVLSAEATLNTLGEQEWECFHVQPKEEKLVFYFKKPKRSYLKSLPTSDLMRLVPMMGGE